jgi:gliding motility-associated-like protein
MRRLLFAFLLFFVLPAQLIAQKEAAHWYFGDKLGFRFTNNSVAPVSGGQLQYNEGASAISDCRGNLLFYTDGVTVWNRSHTMMVNGNALGGHYSSTQGSIVVPQPGACNTYFIFTLDAKENGLANGLRYSVVDMNLQGGLGEVVQKNTLLYAPATEKMAAVKHTNGTDYWLVTHDFGTNSFSAWLITSSGVNSTPVASASGLPVSSVLDAIGQMKISPDGTRLAYVTLVSKYAEVFDFDAAAGLVSNPITFSSANFDAIGGLYGVEFSPDGKKLYITNHDIDYLNLSGNLYQFSLDAGGPVDVVNSKTLVGTNQPMTDLRGLQLAIDGKIYVSRSLGTYAGVIQQPNLSGLSCNYTDLGVATSGNTCSWTFPSFISTYFLPGYNSVPEAGFEHPPACENEPVSFSNTSINTANAQYFWDFGDSTTSTIKDPVHVYTSSGVYAVTLVVTLDCCLDTVVKTVEVEDCFYSVYVPNAFTPNGDGFNETLPVVGKGISDIDFVIFNRWGQVVHQTNALDTHWKGTHNGENCTAGVYAYALKVRFSNGEIKSLTGTVALIR